jgi:hypothetical protein
MPSSIILPAIFGSAAAGIAALGAVGYAALGFAINLIASTIISRALGSNSPTTNDAQNNPNPGSRTQVPPAGDNKLPVVYGSAYVGGIVTDLSITSNNQTLYYVLTLAECTNTEQGGTPDTYTFGDFYWGGKKLFLTAQTNTKLLHFWMNQLVYMTLLLLES